MGYKIYSNQAFGRALKQARITYGENGGVDCARKKYGRPSIKKYTQELFAEDLGVSYETVRNWEQGRTFPEFKMIVKICNFLGCDMDYLFGHIDLKTHNAQYIHDHTGLSERAIEKLNRLKKENRATAYCDLISLLIEDFNAEYLLSLIGKKITFLLRKREKTDNGIVKDMIQRTMKLDVDGMRLSLYKDSLLDSVLQAEIVKLVPFLAEAYKDRYSDSPEKRMDDWNAFRREKVKKHLQNEISEEEYKQSLDEWLSEKE